MYRKNNHLQVWKCILHTFLFLLLLQLFFIGCLSYQWASLHLFLKLLQFALVNLDTNTGKRRQNVENCPSAATTGDANPTRVLFVKNEHWRLWLWSQMMRASGCVVALNWLIVIRLWALPLYYEFLDKYVAHKQFMHHYKGKKDISSVHETKILLNPGLKRFNKVLIMWIAQLFTSTTKEKPSPL